MQLASGTGNQIIEAAEQRLKEAQKYERAAGSAQTGTPLGDDYANAQRRTQEAQRELNNANNTYGGKR